MTKADKQIIETLQNIQKHCQKMEKCEHCRFCSDKTIPKCQIVMLARELYMDCPNGWDMKKIEWIITDGDV